MPRPRPSFATSAMRPDDLSTRSVLSATRSASRPETPSGHPTSSTVSITSLPLAMGILSISRMVMKRFLSSPRPTRSVPRATLTHCNTLHWTCTPMTLPFQALDATAQRQRQRAALLTQLHQPRRQLVHLQCLNPAHRLYQSLL